MDDPGAKVGSFFRGVAASKWSDPETYLDEAANMFRPEGREGAGYDSTLIESLTPGGDETLFEILALMSAAYGVRSRGELMFATIAHILWWLTDNKGLDAITNALASVQIAKGRYATAALPTLKATLDTTKRISKTGLSPAAFSWRAFFAQIVYLTGIFLVWMKIL